MTKTLNHKPGLICVWFLCSISLLGNFLCVIGYTPSTRSPHGAFRHNIAVNPKSEEDENTMISWLIVGGGIHGTHIATQLMASGKAISSSLSIIDENECLLQKWKTRTSNTGMKYLRSSAGYHLDVDENSLRRQFHADKKIVFARDYERPRLDIFNHHCDDVIEKFHLNELHQSGKVVAIEPNDDYVEVQVNHGDSIKYYKAENVVLALGNDEPSYPDWVNQDDVEQGRVCHLLDDKSTEYSENHTRTAVIGGGITAAHKALELVQRSSNSDATKIYLISRHPMKEQQFDTHQDWMMDRAAAKRSEESGGYGMPKRQRIFSSENSMKERRKIIAKERIPGTVTPAVNRGENGLRYEISKGNVKFYQTEVVESEHSDNNRDAMKLLLSSGETIEVDLVLLATGFGRRIPGGKLVSDLAEKHDLRVSDFCGFPIVNENLSWTHPRLFCAGALAELELGPSARNIAGARLAAERIIQRN